MLAEFFTVSGYAFWIIIGIILVLDVALLSIGEQAAPHGVPVFITVAGVVGAVLFSDAFADVRIATLAVVAVVYLFLGVLWAFKKWYDFIIEKKKTRSTDQKPPLAAKHKAQITSWMTLWPFSFTWWVLTWPRRAFVWLYDRLSTVFDRISERIWAS